MQAITIKYLSNLTDISDIKEVSKYLDGIEKHPLEFAPWTDFPYKPTVSFAITYSKKAILLKFFVEEKQIRAINHTVNSSIWEDSCVEFFIKFPEDENYYNIEFNCIGTGLIGYGRSKEDRQLLNDALVHQVKTLSQINAEKGEKASWELTLIIPISIFEQTALVSLEQKECRANFHKCGDLLPDPHFITWSNIVSEEPNFHLPEFFGYVTFE